MHRHRERARLFTVELPGHFIDAAIARGLLDAEQCADAWAVIQACYAALLSDARPTGFSAMKW